MSGLPAGAEVPRTSLTVRSFNLLCPRPDDSRSKESARRRAEGLGLGRKELWRGGLLPSAGSCTTKRAPIPRFGNAGSSPHRPSGWNAAPRPARRAGLGSGGRGPELSLVDQDLSVDGHRRRRDEADEVPRAHGGTPCPAGVAGHDAHHPPDGRGVDPASGRWPEVGIGPDVHNPDGILRATRALVVALELLQGSALGLHCDDLPALDRQGQPVDGLLAVPEAVHHLSLIHISEPTRLLS